MEKMDRWISECSSFPNKGQFCLPVIKKKHVSNHPTVVDFVEKKRKTGTPVSFCLLILFWGDLKDIGWWSKEWRVIKYPPKTNMTMENPPWKCISYWKCGFSNVMLVFNDVKDPNFGGDHQKFCLSFLFTGFFCWRKGMSPSHIANLPILIDLFSYD